MSLKTLVDACTSSKDWTHAYFLIGKYLELDTQSRNGFKKLHENWKEVMLNMRLLYTDYQEHDVIIAALMNLLRDIVADAVLRDRMFAEGWIPRIVEITKRSDYCRNRALKTLSRILMHPSPEISLYLYRNSFQQLCSILFESPPESEDADLVIQIMGPTLTGLLAVGETPKIPTTFARAGIDVVRLRALVLDRMQGCLYNKPDNAASTCHELMIIMALAYAYPEVTLSTPRVLECFVACLRSSSLQIRVLGMRTLHSVCGTVLGPYSGPDVVKLVGAMCKGYPAHLNARFAAHAPTQCFAEESLNSRMKFQALTEETSVSLDWVKFGKEIAKNIIAGEAAIFPLPFSSEKCKLDFDTWFDAIPFAASVLRARSDFDSADLIEVKYLMNVGQWMTAADIARKGAKRSPNIGFWYQILCASAGEAEGVRLALEGLKCPILAPYTRSSLLYTASTRSFSLALKNLTSVEPGDRVHDEGLAYLNICAENLETLVKVAAPDFTALVVAANLNLLVQILLRGPEISPDLKALESTIKDAREISEIDDLIQGKGVAFDARKVKDIILGKLVTVSTEWAEFIQCTNASSLALVELAAKASKPGAKVDPQELVDMLNKTHLEEPQRTTAKFIRSDQTEMRLYRCSQCQNPSAAMRKCAVCGQACYCNRECQKKHWKAHKKACKSAVLSA
ncbi:hypothetical protein SISNIDRAFT_448344 [Sistotremastrum niveocremeum HHB9708]|uniref:MYND-type domain-containing protein n=1 Tax=Sistotremastrum niveocremeum HHB9708 TaxID=1314777 RepID=A0A164ZX07_9AGAM|nr:hypothetical protein SISNIDRAFT_448344 [Sistotremastrum niveocremeum HHB9708]